MTKNRRDFLRKSLKIGAVAGASAAIASESLKNCAATLSEDGSLANSSNGVVCGKAVKKEVLYKKNNLWEQYYKVARF